MIPVLLQQDIQFFAQPDPAQTRVVLIVFGLVVAFGAVAAFLNSRGGKSGGGHHGGHGGGLNRRAKKLGLSADQRRALKELVRTLGLQNPSRLLTHSAYLNHALKRRIEQLDLANVPEAERERQKSLLFSVKRTIQNATANVRVLPSSRHIKVGHTVRVRTPDAEEHELLVASNVHNGIGIELPYQRRGSRNQYKKGAELRVSFVDENDRLYSFGTRVIGYNTARGGSVMFVEHASNIRQTQKRKSPRREYDRPCYFYPVTVLTTGRGRKRRTQAFVNKNRRIFGRFEDLSAGGCAIRTQVPLPKGDILKIDFENADGTPISVYGMVRAVERQRAKGRLMHIKFTRVSRKHLNQIQSYVYGLTE
ncbi:MAG: PilZ domain-containing protein [Spirochaetota bacterium]